MENDDFTVNGKSSLMKVINHAFEAKTNEHFTENIETFTMKLKL